MLNKFLQPKILQQLDSYLLKNKPDLWSSRVHLVFYYSLLTSILTTLAYWLLASEALQPMFEETWLPYMIVISIVGIIVYLVYLLRFNVFKRYGKLNIYKHGLQSYMCHFIALLAILLPCFVPQFADHYVAKRSFNRTEIVQDANNMNLHYQLANDGINTTWQMLTVEIIKDTTADKLAVYVDTFRRNNYLRDNDFSRMTKVEADASDMYDLENSNLPEFYTTYVGDSPKHFVKTWLPIKAVKSNTDARALQDGEKINDVDYYIYAGVMDSVAARQDSVLLGKENRVYFCTMPNFSTINAVSEKYNRHYTNEPMPYTWPDKVLWEKMVACSRPNSAQQHRDTFRVLSQKYLTEKDEQGLEREELVISAGTTGSAQTSSVDSLSNIARRVDDNMENVLQKLNTFSERKMTPYFVGFCMLALIGTVLLMIYRHTTTRAFWLSVLVAVIISIFTGLALISSNSDEQSVTKIFTVYLLVSIVLAAIGTLGKKQSMALGIALNLCVALCAMLPSFILGNIQQHYSTMMYAHDVPRTPAEQLQYAQHEQLLEQIAKLWIWMPIITAIIMLVLMVVAFVPAYKKWYSLPQD